MPTLSKEERYWNLRNYVLSCQRCQLGKLRGGNSVPPTGNLRADILFVGEAPGMQEEQEGYPFVVDAPAGRVLTDALKTVFSGGDDSVRNQFFFMNTVQCRPKSAQQNKQNGKPTKEDIEICNNIFMEFTSLVDPKVIVALGTFAASKLLQNPDVKVGRERGKLHWYYYHPVIATWHPAYIIYEKERQGTNNSFLQLLNDLNLVRSIVNLPPGPDFKEQCHQVVMQPAEAGGVI